MSVDRAVRERQSRVSKSGRGWEEYVRNYLNSRLHNVAIEVIPGGSEAVIRKRSLTLWRTLGLARKNGAKPIWGDVDLLAVKANKPIGIISCKTSLHGRLTETLFYYLLFNRKNVKVVLATPDAGSGIAGQLRSEWGSPSAPTKNRDLAESFLDGVYVENVPEFCTLREPTALGGKVKHLKELPDDLKRWAS